MREWCECKPAPSHTRWSEASSPSLRQGTTGRGSQLDMYLRTQIFATRYKWQRRLGSVGQGLSISIRLQGCCQSQESNSSHTNRSKYRHEWYWLSRSCRERQNRKILSRMHFLQQKNAGTGTSILSERWGRAQNMPFRKHHVNNN